MPRTKGFVNKCNLPDREIEAIARCIYPDIVAFYESEEGQREFAEWKRQQKQMKGKGVTTE